MEWPSEFYNMPNKQKSPASTVLQSQYTFNEQNFQNSYTYTKDFIRTIHT